MARTAARGDELLGANPFPDYNSDERRYSVHVRETLMRLLRGDRQDLELLTKYHREPNRLGIVPAPPEVDAKSLRLEKVEEILSSTIRFLHDGTEGGPIAQCEQSCDGAIVQTRDFPTRFPHIVIVRQDTFEAEGREPIETTWCVYRLQNQRQGVRQNQILNALNLAVELLKWGR